MQGSPFFDAIRDLIRWESDARVPHDEERVAVFAHWSKDERLTQSVSRLARQLIDRGYFVLLSSASPAARPLSFSEPLPAGRYAVMRKPNIGYDFGSWSAAMLAQPQIFDAGRVLQVNDSLVGPFNPLDEILQHFEETACDWWGMVRSVQFTPHMQSFFLGFTPAVLQSQVFQEFWSSVRVESTKTDVIHRYELGLSRLLESESFASEAFLEAHGLPELGENPLISGWEASLRLGVPFVKRELVRNPAIAPGGERVSVVVRDMFEADLADWI